MWSDLGESLGLGLWRLGMFPSAGDSPSTTFVPFMRVHFRRVFKCDLVVDELVLAELQPESVVNRGGFD